MCVHVCVESDYHKDLHFRFNFIKYFNYNTCLK